MKLLLLMTTGMSLKKWDGLGQLSRELDIYNKLSKKIGEVYFYSYGYRENHFIQNYTSINVISKKSKFWNYLWFSSFIIRYINYLWNCFNLFQYKELFRSIDIIKTNQFHGALWGVIIGKLFRKKLVIRMGYYHSHLKKISWKRVMIEKVCFSYAEKLFVTNKKAKSFICTKYKILPQKVIFLPNGIDVELFCPQKVKKKYDFIFVGRLEQVKNLEQLMVGFSKFSEPSLKIIFIGSGYKKDLLLEMAKKNNINLQIINRVDNLKLPLYYNESKIFVLPSIFESNPKSLLEAMSCGLPIIATNVPGVREIISHCNNGYLCEPNSEVIFNALSLLINNEKLQQKLGKNGREYIVINNSLDFLINKEAQIYKSLIR